MSVPPSLELSVERDVPGTARVRARGELDLASAGALEDCLASAAAEAEAVVLDLAALTFMDSTGVRLLLQASERAASAGRSFAIVAPAGGEALMTLHVTGVLDVLPIAGGTE